jgi:hypothetical protein
MTNKEFRRAYVEDAEAAHALFEQMGTRELTRLRQAFTLDLADADKPEGIAFCAGRLALLTAVLARRGDTPQ